MSYAVPTQKIVVDLYFEGREPRRGELFVADPRRSPRSLVEVLEGPATFLPFVDQADKCVTLVNRDQLCRVAPLLVALDREDTPANSLAALTERRQPARIELRDGTSLEGEVWYAPPAPKARLSDHLNEPARFLQFHCGERVHFVHKARIARVLELTAPERAEAVR